MDHRRRALLVQAGVALGGVITGSRTFAQSRADFVTARITINRTAAVDLLADVHRTGFDMNAAAVERFVGTEAAMRKDLVTLLNGVPEQSRPEYVLREQQELVAVLRQDDVPPVPTPDDVQPFAVPTRPVPAGCEESLTQVIVDICVTTVGFNEDVQAVLRVAFEQSPELNAYVDQISQSIGLRDAEQAVDGIVRIVTLLGSQRFRQRLQKIVGAEAWKKISRHVSLRLAAKCVPIVGWVYTAVAASTAVYVNWGRLAAAAKCRAAKA
jgi:hypothetical protein